MKRGKCPITGESFNCLECKVDWGNDRCPYMEWDDLVHRTLEFLRKVVADERIELKPNPKGG